MNEDNKTVEELLKSLRETVEKRAAVNNAVASEDKILDLRNPVSRFSFAEKSDENIVKFVQDSVDASIRRILSQNGRIIEDSLMQYITSEQMKSFFANVCSEYLESRNFEEVLRDIIEKKISSLLK